MKGIQQFFRYVLAATIILFALSSVVFFIMGLSDSEIGLSVVFAILFVLMVIAFKAVTKSIKANRGEKKVKENRPEKPAKPAKTTKPAQPSPFKIDYIIIAGQESQTKAGSAIARGVAGSFLLGSVGLLAAGSAKKNTTVTLIIHYENGRTQTKTVKLNSKEFKKYAQYIR